MQNGLVSQHVVDKKIGRDILGVRSYSPKPGHPAQGSSARKVSPLYFWMQNPAGIELMEETSGVPSNSS